MNKNVMRNSSRILSFIFLTVLCLPGVVSCQKDYTGTVIRFSAKTVSVSPQTRTAYSGELVDNFERINWTGDDLIRIYSDVATCTNAPTYHWADYNLNDISSSGHYSTGSPLVNHPSRGGLAWGSGVNTFYSIYPSPLPEEITEEAATTVRGSNSSTAFSCNIQSAQTGVPTLINDLYAPPQAARPITVYYPPMDQNAYMVAYSQHSQASDIAFLEFQPAYTAFHIKAGVGSNETDPITITQASLEALSTPINGNFSAYYNNSNWTFSPSSVSGETGTQTTFTFNGSSITINPGSWVEFVIFALPQELTGLTLRFTLSNNETRALKLMTATAGTFAGKTYGVGEYLRFDPCIKHYLTGMLIPGSLWTVDNNTEIVMNLEVKDWDSANLDQITYGEGPIVNATRIERIHDDYPYYSFSVYAPLSSSTETYSWEVTALNQDSTPAAVTLTQIDRETYISNGNVSQNGVLTGNQPVHTDTPPAPITFSVTGGTPGEVCILSFSVISQSGARYSINSEVARNETGYQITLE